MVEFEDVLRTFRGESEERLAEIEEALVALESNPGDIEAIGILFRNIHTLKGDAGVFGFGAVVDLAHVLEDVLEAMQLGKLRPEADLLALLLQAVDELRLALSVAIDPESVSRIVDDTILAQLRSALTGSREQPGEATEIADPAESSGRRLLLSQTRNDTLRVGRDKLDRILDLVGEMGVSRGKIAQMLADEEIPRSSVQEAHAEADLVFLELQELVMKARMVAVGPVFRFFIRTVHDVARSNGKSARLVLEGEEIEVDVTVIERLRDPLIHLVRNAIDHGIEEPETRIAAGKDPCGVLTLSARHDAGTVVVELSDDGSGLDRQLIARKAAIEGLSPESAEWTDAELDELLFVPGFSTRDQASSLSGRGIGMDVVRRDIESLRGSLSVSSRSGEGTVFTIRLPLTLAVIRGFQVEVDGEVFILPLDSVTESLAFEHESRKADGGVVNLRGKILPFVRLRKLFGFGGSPPARESIVVVSDGERQAGLVVDELLGLVQAVIKPLSQVLHGLHGIFGSAILASGRVALIVDVSGLLRQTIDDPSLRCGLETEARPRSVATFQQNGF